MRRNMHINGMFWASYLAAMLLLGGCRKELCYNHEEHNLSIKVEPVFSWELEWERSYAEHWPEQWNPAWTHSYESLRPEPATGVRALVYHEDGTFEENNLELSGDRLSARPGIWDILFYKNDTEYILFDEVQSVASATATTRSVSRTGFTALHAGERTMNPPDMLFGHYLEDYAPERTLEAVELPVPLRPLTYTYYIHYHFAKGQQYMALARGALAGMAERVFLKDGHTDDRSGTVLFDATLTDDGAEAVVKSFGVPNYPGDHYNRADGSVARFTLNLEVRMKNGKFKNFSIDVTNQLLDQPRGGVVVVDGLEITDEEGGGGGGGFDVEVDGWGDQIDIPLPL